MSVRDAYGYSVLNDQQGLKCPAAGGTDIVLLDWPVELEPG